MARRQIVRTAAGRKNDYDWEGVQTTSLNLASAVVTQAEIFLADQAETLVRMRGLLIAGLSLSGSQAGDACVIGLGLIVGSAGSTQDVNPIDEAGANWLWHIFVCLQTEGIVGGISEHGSEELTSECVLIDNKAMRKLREDESIFFIVANSNISGSPVVNVLGAFRALTAR